VITLSGRAGGKWGHAPWVASTHFNQIFKERVLSKNLGCEIAAAPGGSAPRTPVGLRRLRTPPPRPLRCYSHLLIQIC